MLTLARRARARLAATTAGRVVRRYAAAGGGTWAQVIAWNGLFAFFPIVLVAVTALGLLLQDAGIAATIEGKVAAAVGGSGDDQRAILSAFEAFRQRTGLLAVIAFVGLLWSGSALMGAFDSAVNAVFPCPRRSFVRQKLMSVGMILVFTVLTMPLILSSSALAVLRNIPGVPDVLTSGVVAYVVQPALGLIDGALLLGAIYYVVPNRPQRLRDILPGALAGGALLEVLTLVFPLYFGYSNGFATYGKTFALFFVVLTYFYFLGQIVMVGATVNAELHPSPGAANPESPRLLPEARARVSSPQ